jgi:hypothetical protein
MIDKNKDEPTQEISKDLYVNWLEAKTAAAAWAKLEKGYRDQLEQQIGDAFAATVDGEKVISYRPANGYAEAALRQAYPDLAQHYVHTITKSEEVFDMDLFARAFPEVAARFRIRPFKAVES